MTTTKPAASAASWLVGGGEMGERIRARDWSRTPLGPLEHWQQSLRVEGVAVMAFDVTERVRARTALGEAG